MGKPNSKQNFVSTPNKSNLLEDIFLPGEYGEYTESTPRKDKITGKPYFYTTSGYLNTNGTDSILINPSHNRNDGKEQYYRIIKNGKVSDNVNKNNPTVRRALKKPITKVNRNSSNTSDLYNGISNFFTMLGNIGRSFFN